MIGLILLFLLNQLCNGDFSSHKWLHRICNVHYTNKTGREVQDLTNKHNHIVKGYNTLTSMQLYLSDYSFHQSQTDGIPSQEQVSGCKEEDNVVLFMQHVQ